MYTPVPAPQPYPFNALDHHALSANEPELYIAVVQSADPKRMSLYVYRTEDEVYTRHMRNQIVVVWKKTYIKRDAIRAINFFFGVVQYYPKLSVWDIGWLWSRIGMDSLVSHAHRNRIFEYVKANLGTI
jgi:hypothetical protein